MNEAATTDTTVEAKVYDAVVVGGGAAGLSGALALSRARRSVLVIDSRRPRNAPSDGVHVYLGREGTPPSELMADGREEIRRYGAEVRTGEVVSAERDGSGFLVALADGTAVRARRLLVTTGLVDGLPQVPGVAELWGSDVLHCPYCHGWEVRDQRIGVLSTGPLAVHQALLWRQWSDDVTLFLHTGPEPDDEQYEQLAARGIAVVDGTVHELVRADGRLAGVRLDSGRVFDIAALAVATRMNARAEWLTPLGLELAEQVVQGTVVGRHIPADPLGKTAVPGVWAAGNVVEVSGQVMVAAAAGLRAGAAVNADLIAEDTRAAVAERRAAAEPGPAPVGAEPELAPVGAASAPPRGSYAPFSARDEREVCERVGSAGRHRL
ncbi:NAD(P)/FAD-dependent oxidoreductase [Streptomyces luteolus]|uniref:NAD(P)/FAD-dependent oxidoreductase n=1 Tax=Streptomyces luteolus TaxID=3043615 RepID=A0ABT6T2K9_9ACTN|nr:NAD(P)/FAD-dependent oxidoreductase [Streptomyces sp. B-S-A12]MDI3421583.1 NAD(P)/FAD-dependent oxidoreductase [Streptomyces sp. B-S-A12]